MTSSHHTPSPAETGAGSAFAVVAAALTLPMALLVVLVIVAILSEGCAPAPPANDGDAPDADDAESLPIDCARDALEIVLEARIEVIAKHGDAVAAGTDAGTVLVHADGTQQALDPAGAPARITALASSGDALFAVRNDTEVVRYDDAGPTVVATAPFFIVDIEARGDHVYLAEDDPARVRDVDLAAGTDTTLLVDDGTVDGQGLAIDDDALWFPSGSGLWRVPLDGAGAAPARVLDNDSGRFGYLDIESFGDVLLFGSGNGGEGVGLFHKIARDLFMVSSTADAFALSVAADADHAYWSVWSYDDPRGDRIERMALDQGAPDVVTWATCVPEPGALLVDGAFVYVVANAYNAAAGPTFLTRLAR